MNVALLGTGLLGAGMVENLLGKGHTVSVWNRTAAKAERLGGLGARVAATPADAARGAERVHLVLSADDAVDATIDAARPGLEAGAWILDHSTNLPPRVASRHAALRADGLRYVHAPVFMGPQNAREASGIMLLSASSDEAAALTPLLGEMTGKVWHVGDRPDLAAVYKLVGNGLLVSFSGAFGDVFAMAAAQGLSPEQTLAIFDHWRPGGALPMFGARVAARGTNPVSWELDMARKDVRLMIESAGGPEGLVVLPAVAQAMDEAIAEGLGQKDYAVYAWPRGRR